MRKGDIINNTCCKNLPIGTIFKLIEGLADEHKLYRKDHSLYIRTNEASRNDPVATCIDDGTTFKNPDYQFTCEIIRYGPK